MNNNEDKLKKQKVVRLDTNISHKNDLNVSESINKNLKQLPTKVMLNKDYNNSKKETITNNDTSSINDEEVERIVSALIDEESINDFNQILKDVEELGENLTSTDGIDYEDEL